LSDDVLGILVHTAEQRRADPVLVPQSYEAKAWRGGDDAAAVLWIAFGSEHRQLNPSEIRTEAVVTCPTTSWRAVVAQQPADLTAIGGVARGADQ